MRLSPETLRAYRSAYLDDGWLAERFELASVDVEPGRACGIINLQHSAATADEAFHLSAIAALRWISQLGIIYACWEQSLPRKAGEVYLRDLALRFRDPVTRRHGIRIEVAFPKHARRRLPAAMYYRQVAIDVDAGAMTGTASFLLPVMERAATTPPVSTAIQPQ